MIMRQGWVVEAGDTRAALDPPQRSCSKGQCCCPMRALRLDAMEAIIHA
jgi:hypothetical protein